MTLLIFYAIISIFFSFLCSILEAVLLSVTPTFINVKKSEGKAYANTLDELKKDVDKPLIAILTLNTIAHTVGAILVGKQAETLYGHSGGYGVFIISTVMTILILVASEIIPKTIGATYWRQLGNFTAKSLKIMVLALKYTGLLWVLQLFTKLIGGKGHHGSVLSREDFTVMADMAHKEGVFQESESNVIKNLLTFNKVLVKDIMTPRSVVSSFPSNITVQEYFNKNEELPFSRIPIYGKSLEDIKGYVLKDVILEQIIRKKEDTKLIDIKRDIIITTRDTPLPKLYKTFITTKEHIALVVDEYNSVSGIVTMEDVIETLLGEEITDESDKEEDLQKAAYKKWAKTTNQS